jgi:hypothetical protein
MRESGKSEESEKVRQRVIDELSAVIGEAHPNVTALRQWRLQNRDLEPQVI